MSTQKINHTSTGEYPIQKPSLLLIEAMDADSNRELEWLWVADNVESETERIYCLRRALYINPKNVRTRLALEDVIHQRKINQSTPDDASVLVWFGRLFKLAKA